MATSEKWVYQPSYYRYGMFVRGSWQFRELQDRASKKAAYHHPCPICGEEIISVRMKRGGWAHYFAADGLTHIKHPCMHRLEGYSKVRDQITLELPFDEHSHRKVH